jgi:hypothetical protein
MPIAEVARWRIIYDMLQPLAVGEVLTYETMAERLGLDPASDRQSIQMAARRALRELLEVDHRAADAVKNVGYRIAKPVEHIDLARQRNRRAGRQIAVGHSVATKVNLDGMDPQSVSALAAIARGFAMQAEINRRLAARQEQHEEMLGMLMERVERLEKGR